MAYQKQTRLPPGCGAGVDEPLLYNPYQQAFQQARRLRYCLTCKLTGSMTENGVFVCPKCQISHTSNLTAPRVYDRLLVLAGRGGGKTLIGAHAAREEMMIPNSIGWVMGPTYKILHDSTFPTLVRLIPPHWIRRWDSEHMEITLHNGAMVAFRSLEDPERARGPHGVSWGWFDEAAQSPERAYDVFEPTLIKAGGIIIASTTVLGYDWTYDKIEKRALVYNEPGYWACRYWTEENPLFKSSPVMARQIERARKTMSPEFFAQEYRAERHNASGLIYNYKLIEDQTLRTDDAIRKIIPEWPNIDPSRLAVIGLDSGADHPFGAVLLVATDKGMVAVGEYLQRRQAISQQITPIVDKFAAGRFINLRWAANKNEANLRLEFGLRNIGVIPAENKHEIGIQRVQSWLYAKQLWFAYTCPTLIEQMKAYRYAENIKPATGEKSEKEKVFKYKDELPDALRYGLMSWPALPEPVTAALTPRQQARLDAFDDRTRSEIDRVREFNKRSTDVDLQPEEQGYPIGSFFNGEQMFW